MAGTVEDAVNEYGDGFAWIRGSIIGKGSFGRVYKATLKNPKSKYRCFPSVMAVKSAEVSCSGTIQKEREVMSNLNASPYLIKCFGDETTLGENGVMAYNLLLEYGSGGTLADRIKKYGGKGLPELEVRMHTRSILRGLNHIHGIGYVHCDLKPENILLVVDGGKGGNMTEFQAKIGDFGLAKKGRKQYSKKRKLTEPYWRGTPMYLSPEAVMDSVQDASSDVWAVGCTVLEMLTGQPAWDGRNADEIIRKIGAVNELPKIPNEISAEARDFLKGCLVRKSLYRFTCEMLLNHPFVQCLDSDDLDDAFGESEDLEHLNELESMALVYESDGLFRDEWSEDDGHVSNTGEEREYVVENEGVVSSSSDAGFDRPNEVSGQILSQSVSESRQHCLVNLGIHVGV
ncbi:hypothetical protein OROHE_000309 [Orobanche hederae]